MAVEQAVSAVPEPDNPAFADLHPAACKLGGGIAVPLLAQSRHKLLRREPSDG